MTKIRFGCLVVGVVALGVLASACGGGSAPGVASLSGAADPSNTSSPSAASGASKQQDALKFAQCMRSHGVTNFPDPSSGGAIAIHSGNGIDPNSPTFQSAQQHCQGLLPKPSAAQQQQAEQNALKFSQCMRSHGVTNFPDPQFSNGGAGIKISAGSGLDPNSPTFQAAQKACASIMHLPNGGPKQANGSGSGSGQTVFVG